MDYKIALLLCPAFASIKVFWNPFALHQQRLRNQHDHHQ
jgi:hypothetical protein